MLQYFYFSFHGECVHLPGKAVSEMTYTLSSGTLNPTHSLTHSHSWMLFTLSLVYELLCNITKVIECHKKRTKKIS